MAAEQHQSAHDQVRSLIALAGALQHNGDMLDARVIAARLGISHTQARQLLELLIQAGAEDAQDSLPLVVDDEDTIEFFSPFANTVQGKPLRLTSSEARALDSAFEMLGRETHDSLRQEITKSYYPLDSSNTRESSTDTQTDTEIDTRVDVEANNPHFNHELAKKIDAISEAIVAHVALAFDYRKGADTSGALKRRRIGPLALRYRQSWWYVDAFDLDRREKRSFRLDRMSVPVTTEGTWDISEIPPTTPQVVKLVFSDPVCLDLFSWPQLKKTAQRGSTIYATIPWYPNSNWLPRHLLACGTKVRFDNAALRAAVKRCAKELRRQAD